MASVKLQSCGKGFRRAKEVESRASVARNCSGRSDVGGGLNFLRSAGLGVTTGGDSGAFSALAGSLDGGEAKVVRVSDGCMRGKDAVEKTKRSRGLQLGGGAWMMTEVCATVHCRFQLDQQGLEQMRYYSRFATRIIERRYDGIK